MIMCCLLTSTESFHGVCLMSAIFPGEYSCLAVVGKHWNVVVEIPAYVTHVGYSCQAVVGDTDMLL